MNLVFEYQYSRSRNLRSNFTNLILSPFHTNTISGEKFLRYLLPNYINQCPTYLISAIDTKSIKNYFKFAKNYFIDKYTNTICVDLSCYPCQAKFLSPLFRFIKENISFFHSWVYSYILIMIFTLCIILSLFGLLVIIFFN